MWEKIPLNSRTQTNRATHTIHDASLDLKKSDTCFAYPDHNVHVKRVSLNIKNTKQLKVIIIK